MHYYLSLTSKCNLRCKYCYGKSTEDFLTFDEISNYDFNLPSKSIVKVSDLKKLSENDKNFIITFYGGEPLLEIEKIKEIMKNLKTKEYMIQTNCFYLNKLDSYYTNQFSTIFASIDGTKEHTNKMRGENVYQKVIKNITYIKKNGFKGEIIARMTVDKTSNIYENVLHLYTKLNLFSKIHWQIDAGFWKTDYKNHEFSNWVEKKYNPQIEKLVNWWFEKIQKTNQIVPIYPFIGIVYDILKKRNAKLRCGAGHSCLGIQTNGKIVACPITAGFKPLYMADIKKDNFETVKKNKIYVQNPCIICDIKNICGGRCLYSNKSKLWGEEGFLEICKTVKFLVKCLQKKIPQIQKLIDEKKIKTSDFYYKKYNGCEIIP